MFAELQENHVELTPIKDRLTTPYMTKYERARVLGTRALQISMNAPVLTSVPGSESDPLRIAMKELKDGKIPFVIRRYLPDGSFEDWPIADLIYD
ncbi:hypothetical protein GUITHDRAFT_71663 [Guillardia theta CCMP2712]|uniref:Uncharacterized protein n=1 Tax=Guillardia theta (strain CCMP2712) TaxID=905079 RepID=L1J970_GUITC|nr:hypothetical protein GUITHDRAFT_71663 [Guillardia theta CCMP2712]EKX45103.1 hypothetical protein GUITHDRAFT_71663 [Guillardia theta CCMP2712]|eukprot:XP_005832083.1 hypothetical protein GUITHDRAFT_71663 [Guillardia theta CCMP2712]